MKREKRTAKGGNDANNVCDHLLASADFKVYFHIITGIICDYPGCFSKKSVMIAGSMVKTLSISGVCCEAEMKGTWRFCIFWSVQGPGSRIQFDIPRDRFSLLSISQMFITDDACVLMSELHRLTLILSVVSSSSCRGSWRQQHRAEIINIFLQAERLEDSSTVFPSCSHQFSSSTCRVNCFKVT